MAKRVEPSTDDIMEEGERKECPDEPTGRVIPSSQIGIIRNGARSEDSGLKMTLSALRASPGEIVDVRPLGSELTTAQVVPLMKTSDLEVFRVVVPSGTTVPKHEFSREVIVHCLEGRARLVSPGQVHDLRAGQLLYYSSDESFSVLGLEDASLLITDATSKTGENVGLIG
jgi:quercetin dioxygenase-like cupin family protein